jgi:DNA-binding GntR family transcriptional regulator
LDEIQNVLEIVGSLESTVIASVFERIQATHLSEMKRFNQQMRKLVQKKTFNDAFDQRYYQLNIAFHNVFLNLSSNSYLRRIIMPIKQRLYDFPRLSYIREWELINCDEHDQLIQFVRQKEREKAVRLWQDSHWSFKAHEKFIREFYSQGSKQIQNQLERQQR